MKLFTIVMLFGILEHLALGIGTGLKPAMIGFDLEAVIPTFHNGLIVAVGFAVADKFSVLMGQP